MLVYAIVSIIHIASDNKLVAIIVQCMGWLTHFSWCQTVNLGWLLLKLQWKNDLILIQNFNLVNAVRQVYFIVLVAKASLTLVTSIWFVDVKWLGKFINCIDYIPFSVCCLTLCHPHRNIYDSIPLLSYSKTLLFHLGKWNQFRVYLPNCNIDFTVIFVN